MITMIFRVRKTTLESNTSQRLGGIRLKRVHNIPKKKRRQITTKTILY